MLTSFQRADLSLSQLYTHRILTKSPSGYVQGMVLDGLIHSPQDFLRIKHYDQPESQDSEAHRVVRSVKARVLTYLVTSNLTCLLPPLGISPVLH